MTLYMETTEIPAEKTAAQIQALLVRAGASQIATDYDTEGRISGLRFVLIPKVPFKGLPFSLPVRVDPVFRHIQSKRFGKDRANAKAQQRDREKAERVAWRQALRWLQAQLAMIECGMVEPAEVFLPYLLHGSRTVYETFKAGDVKMLSGDVKMLSGGGKP